MKTKKEFIYYENKIQTMTYISFYAKT